MCNSTSFCDSRQCTHSSRTLETSMHAVHGSAQGVMMPWFACTVGTPERAREWKVTGRPLAIRVPVL
jgi:hypothetical protein